MIFPKAIQNLIEAYGEDMSILEELQKLKHNNQYLIQLGDAKFLSSTITFFMERVHDRPRLLNTIIMDTLLVAKEHFQKSPAGWVYRKIDKMEWRRLMLWVDCNMLTEDWDDIGNMAILDSIGNPIKEWSPFLEKFKSKFELWRNWEQYKVGEWLDNACREQERKDRLEWEQERLEEWEEHLRLNLLEFEEEYEQYYLEQWQEQEDDWLIGPMDEL